MYTCTMVEDLEFMYQACALNWVHKIHNGQLLHLLHEYLLL